jgi:hypothetical protein
LDNSFTERGVEVLVRLSNALAGQQIADELGRRAAQLLGAAEASLDRIAARDEPTDQPGMEGLVARVVDPL